MEEASKDMHLREGKSGRREGKSGSEIPLDSRKASKSKDKASKDRFRLIQVRPRFAAEPSGDLRGFGIAQPVQGADSIAVSRGSRAK